MEQWEIEKYGEQLEGASTGYNKELKSIEDEINLAGKSRDFDNLIKFRAGIKKEALREIGISARDSFLFSIYKISTLRDIYDNKISI